MASCERTVMVASLTSLAAVWAALAITPAASMGVRKRWRTTSAWNDCSLRPAPPTVTSTGIMSARCEVSPTMHDWRSCVSEPISFIGELSLKELESADMKVWISAVATGK